MRCWGRVGVYGHSEPKHLHTHTELLKHMARAMATPLTRIVE